MHMLYNITHISDFDGMSSAALLVRYHGLRLENIFFTSYTGELFEDTVRLLKGFSGRNNTFIITDIGMNDSMLKPVREGLAHLKKLGNKVLWFDHHLWSMPQIRALAPYCDFMVVGENEERCGAELVWEFLCPKDAYGRRLDRLVNLADFSLQSKYLKGASKSELALVDKLGFVIKHLGQDRAVNNRKLREFVGCIARGDYNAKLIRDAYKAYVKMTSANLKKMLSTAKIMTIKGHKVAIGFSTKLQNQQACMEMIAKLKAEISIYIPEDSGHASIRALAPISIFKIAKTLGGGGHPYAAGFTIDKKKYDLSDSTGKEKLLSLLVKTAGKNLKPA